MLGALEGLSAELVEAVLEACLDRTHALNLRTLLLLQTVHTEFIAPARRLIFRNIELTSGKQGRKLLGVLRKDPSLGAHVRSLKITDAAFNHGATPLLVHEVDAIVLLTPNLLSLDSAVGGAVGGAVAVFPANLKWFRFALTAQDDEDDESVVDSDDSDEDANTAESDSTDVPSPLKRFNHLPTTTTSVLFESSYSQLFMRSKAPADSFPLTLSSLDFVQMNSMSPSLLKWILQPATQANALRRLKLWDNRKISDADVTAIVTSVGQTLDEFLFKPMNGAGGGNSACILVALLPNVQRLTFKPGAADHRFYSFIVSKKITHLCVAVPAIVEGVRLALFTPLFAPGGKLANLRRLELYHGAYFPPPYEINYVDDASSPTTMLREVRFSHISARPGELQSFFADVGKGLRTVSLHHVNIAFTKLIKQCPSLIRLELGVAFDTEKSLLRTLAAKCPSLRFVRLHLLARASLPDLVTAVQGRKFKDLKTIDVTGLVPGNIEEDWSSGAGIDSLIKACRRREVEFCLNGRRASSPGSLWSAMFAHWEEVEML
ncbi:hypothetical protein MNV49_006021 [Pseudohyphozyma bogoriensis]|nr:hypothetical protein MNV49_006021 [Pseudohyphozyma bogoriensis]